MRKLKFEGYSWSEPVDPPEEKKQRANSGRINGIPVKQKEKRENNEKGRGCFESGTEFISNRSNNSRYECKPAAQEDPAVESGGLTTLSSYLIRAAQHDLQAH